MSEEWDWNPYWESECPGCGEVKMIYHSLHTVEEGQECPRDYCQECIDKFWEDREQAIRDRVIENLRGNK